MSRASETTAVNGLYVFVALAVVRGAVSLECYRCSISAPRGRDRDQPKQLCSQFDQSARYVVDCPYSTMCMKEEINLNIQHGERVGVTLRDCALQRHNFTTYVDGRWEPRVEVLEPYQVGCEESDDKGARIASVRRCYCRGIVCNAAPPNKNDSFHTDAMAVIVVYNLLKYIRSLR